MTRDANYSIAFPYQFGTDGMTGRTDRARHYRDLLEQLLLTRRGSRLTRPTLGCGLPDLLFASLTPERVAAARVAIEVGVQEHLSQELELLALDVRAQDSTLFVDLAYRVVETNERDQLSIALRSEEAG